MVRNWKDRLFRFSAGIATGIFLVVSFSHPQFWTGMTLAVLFGLFTADLER